MNKENENKNSGGVADESPRHARSRFGVFKRAVAAANKALDDTGLAQVVVADPIRHGFLVFPERELQYGKPLYRVGDSADKTLELRAN